MSFQGFGGWSRRSCDIYGEHGNLVFKDVRIMVDSDGLHIGDQHYQKDDITSFEYDAARGRFLVKTGSRTIDLRPRDFNSGELLDALNAYLEEGY